jgi:hypothetical protein
MGDEAHRLGSRLGGVSSDPARVAVDIAEIHDVTGLSRVFPGCAERR